MTGAGPTSIHPTAVVDPGARLGAGVQVGPFCVVGSDVQIGDGTTLISHVSIEGPTRLGEQNRIHPFASIGGPPQDLKYAGEPTRLTLGSGNTIREYVTMNRGTESGGGVTRVGDENLFMAQAHIAHDCQVGDGNIFANAATLAGHVEIADHATVGAYSGIHQFCRVGREAFIGGYSVVTQDALPWVTTVGNRAKSYGINLVGLKRRGYTPEQIAALKDAYKTLFRAKLQQEEALEQLSARYPDAPEVNYFLDFVRSSERGVCR